MSRAIENSFQVGNIRDVERTLEQMARSLVESGDYRITSRLEPQAEYHPPDDSPKLVAAVVDVETTGTNPDSDSIIELGICLFEYDRQNGRIYKVLGSWEWFEAPGFSIPSEITNITGITDEMVAGHRIDDCAFAALERNADCLQINFGFAAAGHAVKQNRFRVFRGGKRVRDLL